MFHQMEQRTFKNVNNYLNANIYSYLETSGACIIKLITAVNESIRNKLVTAVISFMIQAPVGQSSILYLNVVQFLDTGVK